MLWLQSSGLGSRTQSAGPDGGDLDADLLVSGTGCWPVVHPDVDLRVQLLMWDSRCVSACLQMFTFTRWLLKKLPGLRVNPVRLPGWFWWRVQMRYVGSVKRLSVSVIWISPWLMPANSRVFIWPSLLRAYDRNKWIQEANELQTETLRSANELRFCLPNCNVAAEGTNTLKYQSWFAFLTKTFLLFLIQKVFSDFLFLLFPPVVLLSSNFHPLKLIRFISCSCFFLSVSFSFLSLMFSFFFFYSSYCPSSFPSFLSLFSLFPLCPLALPLFSCPPHLNLKHFKVHVLLILPDLCSSLIWLQYFNMSCVWCEVCPQRAAAESWDGSLAVKGSLSFSSHHYIP